MKYLKPFDIIFENYNFEELHGVEKAKELSNLLPEYHDENFIYKFTNKDNFTFIVKFISNSNIYERTYECESNKTYYGDPYSIVNTVTLITMDFIKKYKPDTIIIQHIYSKAENDKLRSDRIKRGRKKYKILLDDNMRRKINERAIKKYLPSDYEYIFRKTNYLPTSIIRKKTLNK